MTRRLSIFGGNWNSGDNAGSRNANLDYWTENSDNDLSTRGRSDDPFRARRWSRPRRPSPSTPSKGGTRWSAHSSGFGEYTTGFGEAGSSPQRCDGSKPATGIRSKVMGKKYRNLIDLITADATMLESYRLTSRGKRLSPARLEFKEFSLLNLECLASEMREGSYRQGQPVEFTIYDPKMRIISALPFRDRIAQHALCSVIGPIFEATLLPRTYASRPGKGTHAAAIHLQADLRRLARGGEPVYYLKTDFSRYFASIVHEELWGLIEAKVSCRATLRLIEAMLPREGIGLPIGSLVSQIFANVYGGVVDRHLQQDLGERFWFRYMDDLVVLGRNPEHLRRVKESIEALSRERLGLRFSKWLVQSAGRGVNFVGYRIWASHKLLRKDSVTRARRKIKAFRAAGDDERLAKFLAAWGGHSSWADSRNLMRSLHVEVT